MPFATTWTEPKMMVLTAVRKGQMPYDITYTWTVKHSTSERIYNTKQTYRHGCQGEGRWVREGLGVWD